MKKQSGKKPPLQWALLIVLLLAFTAAGWLWSVWARIHQEAGGLDPGYFDGGGGDGGSEGGPDTETGKNITNILLLGIDQTVNMPGRADTIIVMSINEDTDRAAIISIPRDARVEIPGRGLDKINHAMAYRGEIALMKATVEKLLDVPVRYYLYTNFAGFVRIVDLLGGVTMDVDSRMLFASDHSPSINLHPGVQRLSGEQALGYVRFRGDSYGDFGRMERQQKFLRAVAAEVYQLRTVLKLPQLLEEGTRHIRTDMSISQLLAFAGLAGKIDPDEVVSVALPGKTTYLNGVSYVELDMAALDRIVAKHLRWEDERISLSE